MVCGPQVSACALASQNISESGKILLINTTAAVEVVREGIKWTYTTTGGQDWSAAACGPYYANVLKPKTMAMLTENESYNISGRDMYKKLYVAKGINIVADEIFDPGVTDFSTIISRLRQTDPDILSLGPRPASGILIVKQIYEAGWKVQIIAHGDLLSEDMFRVVGPAAEGIIGLATPKSYWAFKNNQVPQNALDAMQINLDWYYAVADRYIKDYGTGQERWAVEYYNLVNAFIHAMQKGGSVEDPDKFRDAMDGLTYQDANGIQKCLAVHRFQNWYGTAVYHQSSKGMDTYEILALGTTKDLYGKEWDISVINDYPAFPELRKIRGY
jgi:ABC-type branched-subunit amino acid transport system substrate-binding protein